ncbi:MAG: class I SAM-dependent methyltransferase [Syntrophobacteraceae bacterium]
MSINSCGFFTIAIISSITGALLLLAAQKLWHSTRKHRAKAKGPCVNTYDRQLTNAEIRGNEHRKFVGGLWEEIGALQLDFLKQHGLASAHLLLDVGCGCLRGGIPCIRYLEAGNYFGLDINASLVKAGLMEIERERLTEKQPNLMVNDKFEFSRFGRKFDYVFALSVFTHLPMNHIIRCLTEIRKVLSPGGEFFATFFEAPSPAHLEQIRHMPGDEQTNYDSDPYHYSFEECQMMASTAGVQVRLIGEWGHPRAQKMLSFTVD